MYFNIVFKHLFIIIFFALFAYNGFCDPHEIIFTEMEAENYWHSSEEFIRIINNELWENEYKIKNDANTVLHSEHIFKYFEKLINSHQYKYIDDIFKGINSKLEKVITVHLNDFKHIRHLYLLRVLFEIFASFISVKEKKTPRNARKHFGEIKNKNRANIEAIQIWMFMIDEQHHPNFKTDFDNFEIKEVQGKFRVKILSMQVVAIENLMSTTITWNDEKISPGETVEQAKMFPIRIIIEGDHPQTFEFDDMDGNVVKVDNKMGNKRYDFLWRDYDETTFMIVVDEDNEKVPKVSLLMEKPQSGDHVKFQVSGFAKDEKTK